MSSTNDVVMEEIRRLVNSYITTLQVRRSVLERLRWLEKHRVRSSKIRHALSGLRSTLRHLESREVMLLRTIEARIASIIGDVDINKKVKIIPCLRSEINSYCYRVEKLSDIDIVKIKAVFRHENINLEKAGFIPEHPKILVVIDKLSGEVEFIVYAINKLIEKFSKFKLPIHIIIRKISTRDLSLIREILKYCFEAEGTFEIFIPGDTSFYLSVSSEEPIRA